MAVQVKNEGKLQGEQIASIRSRRLSWTLQFSNICGTVYRQGNILFTPDGNSLLSPVGNRVSVFDLVKYVLGPFIIRLSFG